MYSRGKEKGVTNEMRLCGNRLFSFLEINYLSENKRDRSSIYWNNNAKQRDYIHHTARGWRYEWQRYIKMSVSLKPNGIPLRGGVRVTIQIAIQDDYHDKNFSTMKATTLRIFRTRTSPSAS
jgi:hypothetical protein